MAAELKIGFTMRRIPTRLRHWSPLVVGLFLSVEREKGSHVGAFHKGVICYFDIGSPSAGLIVSSELCSIASIE